jgi:hypothetical protein
MPRSRNRSISEWRKLVNEYDKVAGEESKSSYCRKVGVSASSFCKWHHRLSAIHTGNTSNFTRVPVTEPFKPRYFWVKLFGLKLIRLELDV